MSAAIQPSDGPRLAVDPASFDRWFQERRDTLVRWLCELIAIPTESPYEERCFDWLAERVAALGGAGRVQQPPPDLERHPLFTGVTAARGERPRANFRVNFSVAATGLPKLLLNAHVDVVPRSGFTQAYLPNVHTGHITGRGAADTKNNIVMFFGALDFMQFTKIPIAYELFADFVVEEEIGGNGTLASILHGCPADEVVVLEPTSLAVFHGHRGCLSFEVAITGQAAHMGSAGAGLSAIDGAVEVLAGLRRLEGAMHAEAADDPAFATWDRPTPVSVGYIHGGEWHGSFPAHCELRGNVGFLPRYDCDDVRVMLEDVLSKLPDPWNDGRCRLTYGGIHNDAYVIDPATPLVGRLTAAVERQGGPAPDPRAWSASCDARLFHRLLGLPVVIFGCGDLAQAHADGETLEVAELALGMRALAEFLATPPAPPTATAADG